MSKPYKFWTREELEEHLARQCRHYKANFLMTDIRSAVHDKNWNPMEDYNGCTFVQDKHHPYVPCFLHDYAWIVLKGGIKHDRKFTKRLVIFGMKAIEAKLWFVGVRLGWIFYYKWKLMIKRK